MALADRVFDLAKKFAPETELELNYNKHYIGFRIDGVVPVTSPLSSLREEECV